MYEPWGMYRTSSGYVPEYRLTCKDLTCDFEPELVNKILYEWHIEKEVSHGS